MEQNEVNKAIGRFMVKIFSLDVLFLMEDSLYVMKREDHWEENKEKVAELRERFKNSMIAGGAFGLALIFSLRRYFPGQFSSLSVNRFLIESLILGGSCFGSSFSVILGASKFVHYLKKDYVLKADKDVYRYMDDIRQKYQVDEDAQVRYLLSTEEFAEWKKYRHQMIL